MSDFPTFLKTSRTALGMSRQSLADAVGMSHSLIQQAEGGRPVRDTTEQRIRATVDSLVRERLNILSGLAHSA